MRPVVDGIVWYVVAARFDLSNRRCIDFEDSSRSTRGCIVHVSREQATMITISIFLSILHGSS